MKRAAIVVLALMVLAGGQPRAETAEPRTPRDPGQGTARAPLHTPSMAQFMSAGYPLELVAARKADRIAWIANDKGRRNVFTAAAPGFHAVRLTSFMKDLEFHNQLFLPKDLRAGEKRPAIVFVHGGPMRQMILGYHYMEVYHLFYGVNQWLASQGYVVLSVNYRSGIGYGRTFRTAPNTNQRGNSEYQDVLAAGKYLQGRPDVDARRVLIWGLSYGGLLVAQALARNSDIFVAGVDMAGVHLYGNNLDPDNLAYKSSAISEIEKWKSPVFLIHGDDDRNVNFAQTVGLVSLLRAHNIPHEIMVQPDDTHETLLYKRWLPLWERMEVFLNRHLRKEAGTSTSQPQR